MSGFGAEKINSCDTRGMCEIHNAWEAIKRGTEVAEETLARLVVRRHSLDRSGKSK